MAKYRKKPVVIEAFQFTGPFCGDGIPQWYTDAFTSNGIIGRTFDAGGRKTDYVEIQTLEGVMRADKGDWIIRGIKGEIYPCKDDIFRATYEAVE